MSYTKQIIFLSFIPGHPLTRVAFLLKIHYAIQKVPSILNTYLLKIYAIAVMIDITFA